MNNDPVLGAAFDAILGNPKAEAEARIEVAKAQRARWGLKEWDPSIPTADATGQKIVFKDRHGFSYTVQQVLTSGAHVRHLFDPTQPAQSFRVEAHARTISESDALAWSAAVATGLEVVPDAGGRLVDGTYWTRYLVRRPSLD